MSALTPRGRAFADLLAEVFRAKARTLQGAERVARSAGLTTGRWQILSAVEEVPAPVAHVARQLGVARQSVQQTADAMAREGLIVYSDNPHHKRARLVAMTPQGRAALDALRPRQVEFANLMGRHHSLEALRTATDVLRQTRATLDAGLDGESS
jgi:DNA-binding MarR family transcriptional regulator